MITYLFLFDNANSKNPCFTSDKKFLPELSIRSFLPNLFKLRSKLQSNKNVVEGIVSPTISLVIDLIKSKLTPLPNDWYARVLSKNLSHTINNFFCFNFGFILFLTKSDLAVRNRRVSVKSDISLLLSRRILLIFSES